MNKTVNKIIQRWRSQRNREMLQLPYSAQYAFVGAGSHALQNLYPVLNYLGIRLKYICCKSPEKTSLIEHRFGVTATTSLDTILNDNDVKGIFVCTSPHSHYDICSRVIESGKYLFVEKPPCQTLEQLKHLIAIDNKIMGMVGMQKRYSPFIQILNKKLTKDCPLSYTLSYHSGAYPEGDPVTDMFMHPVDLVIYLFGHAEITGFHKTDHNGTTIQILLSHKAVKGFIELSTAYSWSIPEESLRINTATGEYRLEQMEKLCHYPHPKKLLGVPLEKTGLYIPTERTLATRENFNPLVVNNQLYSQGFFTEIKAFTDIVEHSGKNLSPLSSLLNTYYLLNEIK